MSRRNRQRRKAPRGKCRVCGRLYVVASAGRLSRHGDGRGNLCTGSGQVPA